MNCKECKSEMIAEWVRIEDDGENKVCMKVYYCITEGCLREGVLIVKGKECSKS